MFSQRSNCLLIRRLYAAALLLPPALLLLGCASAGPHLHALEGALTLSATSFNFNTVVVGKYAAQTLHVSNTGSAPLTLESLTLKSQEFTVTGPSVPRTILPAQTLDYSISFAPTSSGSLSASLQITTNISIAPAAVSLAGVAEKAFAALQASPASISFGSLNLKSTGTQNVTLKNTGDINMTVNGITVAGAGFGYSNISPGFVLAPNQTVTFQVWFKPQTAGNASGTISILCANIATPQEIPVSGAGVAPTPPPALAALQVSPASISFGNLKLKSTGTQNVTLKNTGDINMTVNGITVAGAGFGYSDISPGFSLAPKQTVTFQVWFKPQTTGIASGTISILSANIASPEEIPVSGDGVSSTPPPVPPPQPPVQHTVALSWQASPSSVAGYRIYRSTTSGAGFSPLTATISDLSYADSTVANGATYYYVVTAVDSAGDESTYSNQVTAAIPAS